MANQTDDWKRKLTAEQYRVLRDQGAEAPFSSDLLHVTDDGMFHCAGCGTALFASEDKFDSGTGWPSFCKVSSSTAIELIPDFSHGMTRTEVRCKTCNGHLGHVFDDAFDKPGGQRFCINGAALAFEKKNGNEAER